MSNSCKACVSEPRYTGSIQWDESCCQFPPLETPSWFGDKPSSDYIEPKRFTYKVISINQGSDDWTLIASDGESRRFNIPVDLRYGVSPSGPFSYLSGVSGLLTFNNTIFTDPAPGVPKHVWYKNQQAGKEQSSSISVPTPQPQIPVPQLSNQKAWYSVNLSLGGKIKTTTNNSNTQIAVYDQTGNLLQTNTSVNLSSLAVGIYYVAIASVGATFNPTNFGVIPNTNLANNILLDLNFTYQLLYNTGVNNNNVTLADNALDPHWQWKFPSASYGPAYAWPLAYSLTNLLPNNSISRWIAVTLDPHPVGIHNVKAVFNLSHYPDSIISASVQVATNDFLQDIIINNTSTGIQHLSLNTWSPLFQLTGFQSGSNIIEFVVENTAYASAFRAALTAISNPI